MLYVSKYDKVTDRYGVTDTDDNVTEWATSGELFTLAKKNHIKIHGISLGEMSIRVVKPPSIGSAERKVFEAAGTVHQRGQGMSVQPQKVMADGTPVPKSKRGLSEPMKKKFADAGTLRASESSKRLQYLDEQIGFDYVVSQQDGANFTQFVISTGGETRTYRVTGTAGDYRVSSK